MTAAVKALAVLGVLGLGGVGVWAVKDYFGDNMLSKYDYAMINFLQKDNTDIVFEVKKGENADQDLTANDITFTNGQPEKVTVSAVVQVTANSQTSFKKGSSTASIDDTEMAEIKALNGGN